MKPPTFHLRLIEDARAVSERYGLLLTGAYAMRAHGLTDRPGDDVGFATADETPMSEVAADLAGAFRRSGLSAVVCEVTPRAGRLVVSDEISGQAGEVHLLRETFRDRPVTVALDRVAGLDDVLGLAARSLRDSGLPRDFIDLAAAENLYGFRELERLGAAHDDEWRSEDLVERLETVDLLADEAFAVYGLDDDGIRRVRRFAHRWAEDIRLRRVDDGDADYDDFGIPDLD